MQENTLLFSNKSLLRLIVPLVIEQGLAMLVGMIDGIMVSSAGEAAISGVSLVDMINGVVLVLFAALATGGAVVTSQFLGARRMDNAKRSVGQLFNMSAVFGLAVMVFCLLTAEPMLRLFFGSIDDDVMAAGLLYFRITACSFPMIAIYNAGAAVFRSVGNSRISMRVSIVMNVINVAGNAICIYGLKMGVAGVAIPTLISRLVAAVMMVVLNIRPEQTLRLEMGNLFPIQWDIMGSILRIGIPSAFENSIFQLGRVVVVSMIALFGTTQTSANAVANALDGVGILAGQAIGLAMITVIGRCVGAQDGKQAVYYIKKLMLWSYLSAGAMNLAIVIFTAPLVGLYSSLTPETTQLSITLVRIHSGFAILLWPASFVLPNALRAANDVKFTMLVSIISMAVWRVCFSWLLCVYFGMGAIGVWVAMVLDWICRVTFFILRTVRFPWGGEPAKA